jgi:DNA topoisomerase-1
MRGRKQYRYHPKWRELRDQNKYEHIIQFAAALPALRDRVAADMKLEGLPREKVLATIVGLLEKTLIRVGNAEYAEKNKSYGLTTMRRKHVAIGRGVLRFEFRQVGEAMETAGRGQAHCLDRQALRRHSRTRAFQVPG